MSRAGPIYHLAPESELQAGPRNGMYFPQRLSEDGFVHCSGSRTVTLAVASDYFADVSEPLYVLEIDLAQSRSIALERRGRNDASRH